MEHKRIDVQESIEEALYTVVLRGEEYRLVDLRVRDRIRMEREYFVLLQQVTEMYTSDEEPDLGLVDRFHVLGVNLALDGVPEDIAKDLTEGEFQVIRKAYADARNAEIAPLMRQLGLQPPTPRGVDADESAEGKEGDPTEPEAKTEEAPETEISRSE